jgi:hypothetical protein
MRQQVSAAAVAGATVNAIRRNQAITYVPSSLALLPWLMNIAPFLTAPVYGRLMKERIKELYAGTGY